MVYGRYIELLTIVYKSTYNWGGTTLWFMDVYGRYPLVINIAMENGHV